MGNVIHSNSFVRPVSYAGVYSAVANEQTAWPASNVGVLNKPHTLWRTSRSSNDTNTALLVDFGVASPGVIAVVVANTNWTSVDVSSSTTSGGPYSSHTSSYQSISADAVTNQRKAYLALTGTVARYVKLTLGASLSTYGYIGTVAFLSAVTTMTSNPGFPLVYTTEQAIVPGANLAGGGRAPIRLGQTYSSLQFATSGHPWSARADLFALARYSSAEPIVVYLNNSDTSQVYICYRTAPLSISQPTPNSLALPNGITFEECV